MFDLKFQYTICGGSYPSLVNVSIMDWWLVRLLAEQASSNCMSERINSRFGMFSLETLWCLASFTMRSNTACKLVDPPQDIDFIPATFSCNVSPFKEKKNKKIVCTKKKKGVPKKKMCCFLLMVVLFLLKRTCDLMKKRGFMKTDDLILKRGLCDSRNQNAQCNGDLHGFSIHRR